MLTQLDLRHFKCFEVLRLPLRPLTLLSGSNASGKSSVLQALVLLHQTMREYEWSRRLMLNGEIIRMGTVSDIVDKVYGRDTCEIGLVSESGEYQWTFTGEREEMSMSIEGIIIDGVSTEVSEHLHYMLPPDTTSDQETTKIWNTHTLETHYQFPSDTTSSLIDKVRDLTYLTAERIGPRNTYRVDDPQVAPVVGPSGEYAVSVLYSRRDEHVSDVLLLPDVPSKNLLQQVEARMRMFFPGCRLDLQPVPQTNLVTLGLRTSDETNFLRPVHTGFGLTQVLPIVIAALAANPDDLLLIENPEVHLHPAGQAMMGRFLADVAQAGVQVILETHSDHVLNGVRRAVKAKRLEADRVAIHFFQLRGGNKAQVVSPMLHSSGKIDAWPDGFFDQFDKDMNYFVGWGD